MPKAAGAPKALLLLLALAPNTPPVDPAVAAEEAADFVPKAPNDPPPLPPAPLLLPAPNPPKAGAVAADDDAAEVPKLPNESELLPAAAVDADVASATGAALALKLLKDGAVLATGTAVAAPPAVPGRRSLSTIGRLVADALSFSISAAYGNVSTLSPFTASSCQPGCILACAAIPPVTFPTTHGGPAFLSITRPIFISGGPSSLTSKSASAAAGGLPGCWTAPPPANDSAG